MALTSADIYEGATLPDVMQDGRLSAVFALDPAAPTVKFMFTIRIPSTSDYAASEKAKFFLIIEVLPIRSGAEADAEARDNIQWLNKCAGQNASVQLGGLRVNRVVSEDNRRNVYCSAMGPREFNVRDHKKVLRKRSRIRTCPTWQFYTPSPAPQRPSRPDPRQRMRETSAELSPPRQQPRPTGSTGGRLTTPLDTPEGPRLSLAKPVPLAPQRSRSPRPLSTHALQFKSLKRPAEGGNDLEMRSEKRLRAEPPSAAAQAGPSQQAATVISIRRMEEERVRQANATRIAKQREEEERLAAEASKLQEPFTSGKWIYKPLAMLNPNMKTDQHVMGVVVEVRQIRPTKGPDCALTLIIADPTTHTDGRASDDRQVTIMRGPIDLKAHDFDVGRPVLFRHLKITSWNGRAKGQAFNDSLSQWYVLRGKKALPGGQRNLAPIGPDEIMRLQALERWYREGGGDDVPAPMQGTSVQALSNTKFRTLGEIVGDQFFDTTVKIVHLIRLNRTMGSDFSPKYELYVCDGTVNPQATHNFHNIDMGVPPGALMCLTIFSSAPEEAEKLFEEGAILHFKNVRSKYYRGAIELKWSETVTDQQLAAGWKNKACRLVDPNQPEAVEIETRLKAMQAAHTRGEAISTPNPGPPSASTTTAAAAAALPPPVHPISTLLMTGYTDEAAHPRSTISEILANTTVPNRFRLLARVLALTPRFPKGASVNKAGAVSKGELAMLWCRRCKNNFPSAHCLSCNDMSLKHAEVRWQMLLTLEGESGGQLDVVLDGDAAAAVLPPLPPLTPDPKEVRRLRGRLVDLRAAAENVLLGARFDGVRTRPLIDWTIESYATGPSGRLEYLHFRVFGMRKGKQ
ncbi:hypothetical protein CC85DRAFT_330894 [Cutaneotrichosporon oleaginosum]|uniref:Telomeric single stranded DNA binding POT1/Cdc13 domain-containing protein n=1 Tax=Cutaneotrichosporon oleaginosum TaxID=879819 RepID=A0A0J0XDS4_9TREE|nr:uncharacterized protein CC85DRAFT_330894 [Cutaneotrichosporon oleaginosum]KLT39255.1 hypothetical protein CC85DRAFT_330894 [Cutaneotrichosporon oleaginosum]TXT09617.1 hypothetical protein COLE_03551 [Cutaneotrichosporon oleaginosum]